MIWPWHRNGFVAVGLALFAQVLTQTTRVVRGPVGWGLLAAAGVCLLAAVVITVRAALTLRRPR